MMRNGDLERGKNRSQKQYSQAPPPQQYHAASTGYGMEYSDRNHYWTSWLVPSIIVANIAMFIVIMYVNNCPQNPLDRNGGSCVGTFLRRFSFQPFRQNPLLGPSSRTLEKLGGLEWNKVVHQNQGWRLISCIWLHAGLFHLAANMISLLIVGIRLEQQFGFIRIGLIYLLSGIGGSILSALFIQQSISVGASGALFGLLGAMLSELLTNWTIYSNKAAALFSLIVIIVINLAVGILPMVDNFAHIGGFVSGVLLGFVLLVRPQYGWLENKHLPAHTRPKSKYTACQYILWIVGIVLFILGFAVALAMLFRGENANDRCSWCHYLSCVPTSRWSCNNH